MRVTSESNTTNRRQLAKLAIGCVALASFIGLAGHADATNDAPTNTEQTVEIDVHLDADLVGTIFDDS